jgi:hypothetical protein
MRLLILSVFLILFLYPLFSDEYVLYDSFDNDLSWEIIPDGYINTDDNNSRLITADSDYYGEVLGVSLEFPELSTPSYYILIPEENISVPEITQFKYLEITIYSNKCNLDTALLVEDNTGVEFEYYIGTLNYEGWKTLVLSLFVEINGFNLKGIVFYNTSESEPKNSNKVFYIKDIILEGYSY